MLKHLAKFFVTFCYIGKLRYAPGTLGSLAAFPVCYLVMHLVMSNQISWQFDSFNSAEQQILTLIIIELIATILLFFLGVYFTAIYIQGNKDQDPKEVVIDEVAGQMLVIILGSLSVFLLFNTNLVDQFEEQHIDFVFLFLLPFVLFRLFDMLKPWPINWLDQNIKGALGVMIDDIAAAIFALVVHYVIVFFVVDYYAK